MWVSGWGALSVFRGCRSCPGVGYPYPIVRRSPWSRMGLPDRPEVLSDPPAIWETRRDPLTMA